MASKQQAMAVAKRFGFVLDESVSGKIGDCYLITLDHPTHSICGDCRSVHVEDYGNANESAASCAWREAIERMQDEGPLLEPCNDPECEYHNPECDE